jgi:hypothetical protein
MYRMAKNAQQSFGGAGRLGGGDGGFSDQQCGIARSQTGAAVATEGNRASGTEKPALLFDQFQQRAATRPMRRFRILRPFRGRIVRHHRIAQSLQFLVCNPIELHPKLENRHRHQLGSLPVGAVDETRPALLECRENQMQSFF